MPHRSGVKPPSRLLASSLPAHCSGTRSGPGAAPLPAGLGGGLYSTRFCAVGDDASPSERCFSAACARGFRALVLFGQTGSVSVTLCCGFVIVVVCLFVALWVYVLVKGCFGAEIHQGVYVVWRSQRGCEGFAMCRFI